MEGVLGGLVVGPPRRCWGTGESICLTCSLIFQLNLNLTKPHSLICEMQSYLTESL